MSSVSVTRSIAAPPEKVYALVTDLPRMGEWSPENQGGSWTGGTTEAAVGSKFKGHNANESKKWSTIATVIAAEPGRRFAFRVAVGPVKVADWSYDIEAEGTGSKVTETWTDRRNWLATKLGGIASNVSDRATHNREGMVITLERLAATAEA
jgi:uncharacterized protein YndB with AHSA1/START domain